MRRLCIPAGDPALLVEGLKDTRDTKGTKDNKGLSVFVLDVLVSLKNF